MKRVIDFLFKNVILTIVLLSGFPHPVHSESYVFISQWGDERPFLSSQLNIPRGIAVDNQSNVYVSDTYNNRIIKYDPNGKILWTKSNCNESPINYPMEMAIDSQNNLYVVEMLNNRVTVFDSSGHCLRTISGNFNYPIGVAVDDNNYIYVTDRRNNAVKKFDSNGQLIGTWTGFNLPWGITYYNKYIYVAQTGGNYKVKKLTPDGQIIKEWGTYGIDNGQFLMAEGIIAFNGLLYVADGENSRIHVFDLDGNFIKVIGERGTGNGQLQLATALAIDRNNEWLYVTDDDNCRIMKFDVSQANHGSYLTQWGSDSSGVTGLRYPTKIAIDNLNGFIYIVDSGNHRIRKLNMKMEEIFTLGGYGDGDGQFRYPINVAVGGDGRLYVLDNVKRNVQVFDSDGNFIAKWDINFDQRYYRYGLQGITVDSGGYVYVIDADTKKLYKLDANGIKVSSWNIDYYSTDIYIDEKNGIIYISKFDVNSQEADTVKKYYLNSGLPTGEILGKGILFHPWDVASDSAGNIYVPDFFHRIMKFQPDGIVVKALGSDTIYNPGTEPGNFAYPYGIAIDKRDYIYVADTNNHRIQKFAHVIFDDVPATYWALPFINKIYNNGITSGCSTTPLNTPLNYCPEDSVTRAEMAVFIITSMVKAGLLPSDFSYPATPYFADVPSTHWAFKFIQKMKELGITSGCTATTYCPDNPVTRAQMAVFLTKGFLE